jgi:hypothetical protein
VPPSMQCMGHRNGKYIPAGTHLGIISTSAAACSSIFRRSVLNCSSKSASAGGPYRSAIFKAMSAFSLKPPRHISTPPISDSASLSCGQISDPAYLNSCPYLRAIALICSRVNSFPGSPGRLQVSRKEAVETRRHHDPQQNQLLIWTAETMPSVLGYENRSTSFARVTDIVECDHATAFQNVEGFVLVEVSVNRNARALG